MIETEGIFVDMKKMLRMIRRAYYLMDKMDRIVYCTPAQEACVKALQAFALAYDVPKLRYDSARILHGEVLSLKLVMDEILEMNVIRGRDEKTGMKADTMKVELVILLGRIDEGVSRYVASVYKGKSIPVG